MNYPKLTVVVPLRPRGSAAIVLSSVKKADYPQDLIEVFVIEGANPSRQRNEAIKKSTGEFIFFLDDDSILKPDLFTQAVGTYRAYPDAIGVGGPAYLYGRTYFEQATIIILTSILGVYKIRARYKSIGNIRYTNEDELISCNLSIRREVFSQEAAFNERLYPNEENELINRFLKKGHKFVYNPNCIVTRKTDDNVKSFFMRIFFYGRGRMEQLFIDKSKTSFVRLLPVLFYVYLLAVPFTGAWYFKTPLYGYSAVLLAFSVYNSRYKLKIFPLVFILYAATHFAYASGEAYGACRLLKNKLMKRR